MNQKSSNKKLSDFKALLFDVDGTLVSHGEEIRQETIEVIRQIEDLGYRVGVCTGRGVTAIKNKILPIFSKNSLHITTGGSQLVDSNGDVAWDNPISSDIVKKIKEKIRNSGLMIVFMKEDALYTDGQFLENLKKHPWNFVVKDLAKMENDGVGAIYIPSPSDEIMEFVQSNQNLSYKKMTNSEGRPYIDITASGVNKSTTLRKWSEATGIPTEKIIGFGDSANDLEFLQTCGFSVAMGNATQEIKDISDRVIGHVNDNGLANYLLEIIQGKNL